MSNVSENLFQAMDIIIAERLNGLNYDKTILCRIEDDSKKDRGEYTVTDGSSTFVAISKDATYMKGSSVYVTVPTGDFNQQKLIVGKYVANNEQYATYQPPFEQYLDITENLIEEDVPTGLLANGAIAEKIIWSWQKPQGEGLRGYSRLGFNAKFRSWLAALEPIAGTYGVRIDIEGTEKTTTEEADIHRNYKYFLTSDEFYGDPYNFDVFYKQEKVFDISCIAEITRIQVAFYQESGSFINKSKVKITACDNAGDELPDNLWIDEVFLSVGYSIQDFDSDTILLYTFDSKTYAAESETKQKADGRPLNEKTLKARWIHFDSEGKCIAIDKEEEMSSYEENDGAQIHWYKHVLQDGVYDDLAGNFWQEVNDGQDSKNLLYRFSPDITAATETYKVIIEMPSRATIGDQISNEVWNIYQKWGVENPTDENIEAWRTSTEDVEDPDTKATITREEAVLKIDTFLSEITTKLLATIKYYESDTFVFENEAKVPDQATLELVQGLSIVVDAVGLKGNYCIYGQSNEILNTSEAHKIRTMEARYESLITNDNRLDKAAVIRWKIPAFGTMIYTPESGKEFIPIKDEYVVDGVVTIPDTDKDKLLYANRYSVVDVEDGQGRMLIDENDKLIAIDGYYIIERNGTEQYPTDADGDGVQDTTEQISVMQDFRIESYYTPQNTNNTVHCEVIKNGLTYKALTTLAFGPQGTNGTDSTLVLKFKDDQPALEENGIIEVEAHLYDYNNTEIQILEKNIKWSFFSKDDCVKIGETTWNPKTITATVQDAAGNTLTEEKTLTYPSVEISWVSGIPQYNIIQCDVECGEVTVGQQAKPGMDLVNNEELEEKPETLTVKLQAFIPIPFRDSSKLTWAEIPTRIVYDDQGKNPSYYKNNFLITTDNAEGFISNALIRFDDTESNHVYYPTVREIQEGQYTAAGWKLEPKVMYFEGLSKKVGLQVSVAFPVEGGDPEIYNWYQPLLIIQNRWPSAMLNAWDGSLTIDEKNGTILSTMVGAGKKEDDNSFTGVLMGDIAAGAGMDAEKHLGVYGFHHGQQSFGFKDDGTAFIGKAGKGRIEFDGNSGSIQSMSYAQGGAGMLIDLDDGFIEMRGITPSGTNGNESSPTFTPRGSVIRLSTGANKNDDGEYVDDEDVTYLTISTDSADGVNGKPSEIMHVGTGKYFLQSADYSEKSGEEKGTKLNIAKGIYTAYDKNGSGSYIRLNSDTEKDAFLEVRYKYKDTEKEINSELIHCGNNNFFLQSADYKASDKIGTRLDIAKGEYISYDEDGSGSYIKLDSSPSSSFLTVHYTRNDTEGSYDQDLIKCGGTSFFLQSRDFSEKSGSPKLGTKLDIARGKYTSYDKEGTGNYVKIDSSAANLFQIGVQNPDDADKKVVPIFNVGKNSFYLRTANYSATNHKGMDINLTSGRMNAYDFNITAYNSEDTSKYISIKSDGDYAYPLDIAGAFKVDWNGAFRGANGLFKVDEYGRLTATKGKIGGWYITDTAITNVKPADYDTNPASTYNMRSGARAATTRTILDGATGQIDAGYGNFNVTPAGAVTAKNIAISGTGSTAKDLTISSATIKKCTILNDGMIFGTTNVSLQDFTVMTDVSISRTEASVVVVGDVSGTSTSVDMEGILTGSVTVATDVKILKKRIWIPDSITLKKSYVKITTLADKNSVDESTDSATNDTGIVTTEGTWYSVL